MEPVKSTLPDVSGLCFATKSRKHCDHFEEGDGSCCSCKKWHPEMCQKGCGQALDDHEEENCTPLENSTPEVFNLITHLYNQREHSLKTFGPLDEGQKVQGILQHIEEEVNEIRKDPKDLEEWIDVVILAFDGAYRSGYTPEQIVTMLMTKQVKNENRQWPDWRKVDLSKPLEHVRTPEEALAKESQIPLNFDGNGTPINE